MWSDLKMWSLISGSLAAMFWFASAVYSILALRVTLDFTGPERQEEDRVGIILSSDGEFTINGMTPPSRTEVLRYQRKAFKLGACAAALNAGGALFGCLAATLAFVV